MRPLHTTRAPRAGKGNTKNSRTRTSTEETFETSDDFDVSEASEAVEGSVIAIATDAMISTCDVAQHVTRDVKNLSTSIGEWSVLSEVFFWLDLY